MTKIVNISLFLLMMVAFHGVAYAQASEDEAELVNEIMQLNQQVAAQEPEIMTPLPDESALQDPFASSPVSTPVSQIDGDALEDVYFDADFMVPASQQSQQKSIKRVNPATDAASKFVVVEKDSAKGSTRAKMVAAQRAMALDRYEAALEIYKQLREKNPKQPSIILGYAAALQKLGRDDEAARAYEDVLDLKPDNLEAHINMLGLISRKFPAVALQRLEALKQKNPDNIGVVSQVAYVQGQLGRYEEALASYGYIASLQPQNASHLFNMAVIADRAGLVSKAIEYYQSALDIDTVYNGGRSIPRDQVFDRLANLR